MIHPIENIIQLKRFILNNISYEKMIYAIKYQSSYNESYC